MRYVSTRRTDGDGDGASFEDVLLAGLARDGGLFVPESWPAPFSNGELEEMAALDYADLAVRLTRPFIGDAVAPEALERMARECYAAFDHPAVAPLAQYGPGLWLMELFHGPTLSFKDYALQFVGRLFDHVVARRGQRLTILGATSGDTGSAAIEACRGRDSLSIIILHPEGRVSEVQRRQMTSVDAPNVHNVAIQGTFDDCQVLVKAMFGDLPFRDSLNLAAVNSINWARIMAQTVYYGYAALALGSPARPVSFAVPTGNFGNVYSGYVAARLGLPIRGFLIATNANDILARFFAGAGYRKSEVIASISPSMDIQVASNFERLLFELHGQDGGAVRALIESLERSGGFTVAADILEQARGQFSARRVDDARALDCMARAWRDGGKLIDPHSAAGLAAAEDSIGDGAVDQGGEGHQTPMICIATAHPAKFPDAVERATGIRPELPAALADLKRRAERVTQLPNDLAVVKEFVGAAAAGRYEGKVA
ncbi:MAG: threonine synthase [Alphaproteobacteria bacterium]|nr:threonine synthase [Alphaproteobacteria bacterium]